MSDDSRHPGYSVSQPHSRLWRSFRFLGFGLLGLVALALVVCLVENWRGARAWNQLKAELEAKGEKLDYQAFIPPPAADEENFATTPLLAPLLDYDRSMPDKWRQPLAKQKADALSAALSNDPKRKAPRGGNWQIDDPVPLDEWQDYLVGHTNYPGVARAENPALGILRALQKFDTELAELETASERPRSVFPVHYEENFNALLPHLAVIKGISTVVRLRALARLKAGQKDEALRDVRLTLRLAECVKDEPFLISQLVRIAILQMAIQPIWEGCSRHDWTAGHLLDLQTSLAKVQILEDYGRAIRGERAFNNAALDMLRTGKARLSEFGVGDNHGASQPLDYARPLIGGWLRQNQVVLNRLHQQLTIPIIDATKHRVFVPLAQQADAVPELQQLSPYNVFARMLYPALAKTSTKFAFAQTALDLATVACALERHRLASGDYPAQLDLLVPKFIEKLPTDVINGEMLKYRREADGSFTLWSVGWNEADDLGEPGKPRSGKGHDMNAGDWVWRFTPIK